MRTSIVLLLLGAPVMAVAQAIHGDSLLASERSIDRPITLHGGQLRVTGGYGLSIIARRFDDAGEVVRLRDEGLASIRHRFEFDIRYGIHEYVQVTAGIAHASHVQREQTRYIFPPEPEPVVSQNVLTESSGMEDLFVAIDLRAPLKTRRFDIAVSLGMLVPVAGHEPATPSHSFEHSSADGTTVNAYTYRYNNRRGNGVPVAALGGMVKFRWPHWALSARADYRHPLRESENIEWIHQLQDASFEYRKIPFRSRLADALSVYAEIEYQPLPWFDLFLNVSGFSASRAWNSPFDGLSIAAPDQFLLAVTPGFEIIVTPRLWLRERLNFSVVGESHEAPFSFQTSVLYNLFPFHPTVP